MKVENLTKHICDVCGKIEYAKKDETSPMQEIRLPMKYYDETGRHQIEQDETIKQKAVDLWNTRTPKERGGEK